MNIQLLCAYWAAYEQISASLTCLKQHNVQIIRYDTAYTTKKLPELVESAADIIHPDVIIYIGVNGSCLSYALPTIGELHSLKKIGVPLVMLCPEASSDFWWWNLLEEYNEKKCFDLIVNTDGNKEWPGNRDGLTLLTPWDPYIWIPRKDLDKRSILCGYGGSYVESRLKFINSIDKVTLFKSSTYPPFANDEEADRTYIEYVNFMKDCKSGLNFAHHGGGSGFHVKGRILEIGLAGAVLIEDARSQTSNWFTPEVDYLSYLTKSDVLQHLEWIEKNPYEAEKMALSLHNRVLNEHSPEIFWGKVFKRLLL